jgi:electron transport complex protein RnfD
MAAKLMIFPSARSRYLSDKGMNLIYKTLLVLAALMVLQNWYLYSFMHGFKLVLMVVLSVIATRETEILFYSHDKDIDRAQSKELIVKSYPEVTGLLFALLIPVGTPLWLTVVGAILATIIGKLIFGGFHHMVFHTSLVGFLFVTLGWDGLSINAEFANSFDNYVLKLLFDNNFFNNTLSIGSVFGPDAALALSSGSNYALVDYLFGMAPGILGIGIVMIGMFGFLVYKKAINWITTTSLLGAMFVISFIIALVNDYNVLVYPLEQIFGGMFLFVAIFLVSDPITTPIPTIGKVIYGISVAGLTVFIRQGDNFMNGTYIQGIVFATLFMSMLTPMLNVEFGKKKKKTVKKVPTEKVGA